MSEEGRDVTLSGESEPIGPFQLAAPPGPSVPPLVPGHLGAPGYEECRDAVTVLAVAEATGDADLIGYIEHRIMTRLAVHPQRLRVWLRSEIDRGNIDKFTQPSHAKALQIEHPPRFVATYTPKRVSDEQTRLAIREAIVSAPRDFADRALRPAI